jgi:hypothetical protein
MPLPADDMQVVIGVGAPGLVGVGGGHAHAH